MLPTIVVPDPKGGERSEFEDLYQKWRASKEESEPKFVIENVRHVHDPEWRTRVMSITAARNQTHPVWVVVKWVFIAANAAFIGGKIIR